MKNTYIFIGLASLFGILAALEGLFFLAVFFLLFFFLLFLNRFSPKQLLTLISIFFFLFVHAKTYEDKNQSQMTGAETEFTVTLQHPMKVDGNFFSTYAEDIKSKEKLVLHYRLTSPLEKDEFSNLSVGSRCQVQGQLKKPERPGNPNMFNYQHYLQNEQIFWILDVKQLNLEHCHEQTGPLFFFQKIRQKGIQFINEQFPENSAPLAIALVFGDRQFIEQDLIVAYQRLGIIHLLAISGLHVGMLMGILFLVGLRAHISREKMMTILIVFLPIYIILTGGAPSVIRACFMMFLALLILKMRRKKLNPADIISIVLTVYLFISPFAIYDVGFQLSFTVSFSLVLSRAILSRYMDRPLLLLCVTSVISQIASIPIMLYHFYEFSLVSLIANLFFIPLYSVIILPLCLLWYILSLLFGELLNPLASFLDFNFQLLNSITLWLSKFPFNTLVLGRPTSISLIILCIGIPYGFYVWEKWRTRTQMYIRFFLLFIFLSAPFVIEKYYSPGEITMIDVGQGDSILIQLPKNKGIYLIDTGGTIQFPQEEWMKRRNPFEVGQDVLIPYLKSKGITTLDKLILTHGDMDHVGGATAVLKEMKVKEMVLPVAENRANLEVELLELAKEKDISVHFTQNGESWKVNGHSFHILSPSISVGLERNDQSIVVYTELGGLKWMFTGDLEEVGESQLLAAYPNLQIDVLKVGHHGSKTSTSDSWLDHLRPTVALISAGKDNRFGHPHLEVINKLEEREITIYRTDRDGAIRFSFTKEKGTFLTGKPYDKAKANFNGTAK